MSTHAHPLDFINDIIATLSLGKCESLNSIRLVTGTFEFIGHATALFQRLIPSMPSGKYLKTVVVAIQERGFRNVADIPNWWTSREQWSGFTESGLRLEKACPHTKIRMEIEAPLTWDERFCSALGGLRHMRALQLESVEHVDTSESRHY